MIHSWLTFAVGHIGELKHEDIIAYLINIGLTGILYVYLGNINCFNMQAFVKTLKRKMNRIIMK